MQSLIEGKKFTKKERLQILDNCQDYDRINFAPLISRIYSTHSYPNSEGFRMQGYVILEELTEEIQFPAATVAVRGDKKVLSITYLFKNK